MHDSNGRIYTESGKGIDVLGDIAYVLGRSTGDVGALCGDTDVIMSGGRIDKGGKINMYSKYKPIRWPSVSVTHKNTPLLYRGTDNKCGIDMPILTHADFILDPMRGYNTIVNANNHTYLSPRGASYDEWFRVLDFDGYRTLANKNPYVFDYPDKMYRRGAYVDVIRHHPNYQNREISAFEYQTPGNIQSAYNLALLDIMSRFSNYSKIAVGNVCGYIGILIWCEFVNSITGKVEPILYLCSHKIIFGQTLNYINIIPPDRFPALGQRVMLIPCIPNYDTEDTWIDTQSLDSLEILLFPKSFPSYKLYTLEQYLYVSARMSYSAYSQVVTVVGDAVWHIPRDSQDALIGIMMEVINIGEASGYAPTLRYEISGGKMDGQSGTVTASTSAGSASYILFGRQVSGSELFTYDTPSVPESMTITFSRDGNDEQAGNKDSFGSLENRILTITRLGV